MSEAMADSPLLRCLAPAVTRDEAEAMLVRRWGARLRSIAQMWIPYYVYVIEGGSMFAIDAVDGSLDLLSIESRGEGRRIAHALPVTLPGARADELFAGKLQRMIYQRGFFRVKGALPRSASQDEMLYVPYWAGFYGKDEVERVRVVDAVRRTVEGAKLSQLVLSWLRTS